MKRQILIIGTGGQGIKTIGKIITKSALLQGFQVSSYLIYTPAARNEESISQIVYINHEENSLIFDKADLVISMADNFPNNIITNLINQDTKYVYGQRPNKLKKQKIEIELPILTNANNVQLLSCLRNYFSEISHANLKEAVRLKCGQKGLKDFR